MDGVASMGTPPLTAAAPQLVAGTAAHGSQANEAEGAPAPKKRKTAAKPYCPQLGTANYAFLIVLYRVRSLSCVLLSCSVKFTLWRHMWKCGDEVISVSAQTSFCW